MWNFSARGLIVIYPQGLLGYKNVTMQQYCLHFLSQLNAIWFSTFKVRSKTPLRPNTEYRTAVN